MDLLGEAIIQELRGAGCEVLDAHTAEEAIGHVHGRRIDAVFTGIQIAGELDQQAAARRRIGTSSQFGAQKLAGEANHAWR